MKVDVPSKYTDLSKIIEVLEARVEDLERKGRQALDAAEPRSSENPEETREFSKRGQQKQASKKPAAAFHLDGEEFPEL